MKVIQIKVMMKNQGSKIKSFKGKEKTKKMKNQAKTMKKKVMMIQEKAN